MDFQNKLLTPTALYDFLKKQIKKDLAPGGVDSVFGAMYTLSPLKNDSFFLHGAYGTKEEFAALNVVYEKIVAANGGSCPYICDTAYIHLGLGDSSESDEDVYSYYPCKKLDHDYLSISISTAKEVKFTDTGMYPRSEKIWKAYAYYGNGQLFCRNGQGRVEKMWPCTMADLFEATGAVQRYVVYQIMRFWGQTNRIWLDLATDFLQGSAYSAIPVDEIWKAHSKAELLQSHYGKSLKRNNQETIGKGIFLARVASIVKEEEVQKLYGYEPGRVYIGKKKSDLIEPLSRYILDHCPNVSEPVNLPRGRKATVDQTMISDAIHTCILLRRKCPLTFHSPRGIYEWHQEVSRVYERRNLPLVKIPTASRFKKLKMPSDCVRLKSRQQFIEEGQYQNNCVASYIKSVNNDTCSIWSMRKEDGERYTIEIRCRTSKNMKNGYFYIAQMFGWGNSECPKEERQRIRDILASQQVIR